MPFRLFDQIPSALAPLRDALDPQHPAAAPEIRLRLHGGIPSQRLDFTVTVRGNDSVEVRLDDRLLDRTGSRNASLPGGRLDVLRDAIARGGLLRLQTILPRRIPPDSVLGELLIRGAGAMGEWRFVADFDQADASGDPIPLALIEGVAPLMTLGKELLEIESVGPYLPADARGPLYIAAIEQGPDLAAEHVVLYNLRAEPLPASGFELRADAGHAYTIPEGTTIRPHSVLRVWTGAGEDGPGNVYQGRSQTIWKNAARAAIVGSNGREMLRRVHATVSP